MEPAAPARERLAAPDLGRSHPLWRQAPGDRGLRRQRPSARGRLRLNYYQWADGSDRTAARERDLRTVIAKLERMGFSAASAVVGEPRPHHELRLVPGKPGAGSRV